MTIATTVLLWLGDGDSEDCSGLVLIGFATHFLFISACGGGDGGNSGTVIEVSAQNIKFVPNEIRVPAGQMVTLRLKNLDDMEHDLEVQGLRVQVSGNAHDAGGHEGAAPGTLALHTAKNKTASITFTADQKGTFDVWCTISGHKELGMIARLIVT
jgi:uncharacterized cupredoxin-like copper-binding protein